ncbi:MAG: peptidylprolyl isomerase A [Halobacteriovoraceae bacterium]|nr:peptidylprolyl isomerase A [Halobacteriovoraceae bacterium]
MAKLLLPLLLLFSYSCASPISVEAAPTAAVVKKVVKKKRKRALNPRVMMKTSHGLIEIELYPKQAPITVKNFLTYVNQGFYDGTIFHRVIENFMIQGGGFTSSLEKKKTWAPIKNEADNGISNSIGTIAMARTGIVDSATAQFFINVMENDNLNYRSNAPADYGYAVFGRVRRGMPVVNRIRKIRTERRDRFVNMPVDEVTIISAKVK